MPGLKGSTWSASVHGMLTETMKRDDMIKVLRRYSLRDRLNNTTAMLRGVIG